MDWLYILITVIVAVIILLCIVWAILYWRVKKYVGARKAIFGISKVLQRKS